MRFFDTCHAEACQAMPSQAAHWVILEIRVPFRVLFTRAPYYVWELKGHPNLENYHISRRYPSRARSPGAKIRGQAKPHLRNTTLLVLRVIACLIAWSVLFINKKGCVNQDPT